MSKPSTKGKNVAIGGLITPFYPDFYRFIDIPTVSSLPSYSVHQVLSYAARQLHVPVCASKALFGTFEWLICFRLLHIIGTTLVVVALASFAVLRVMLFLPPASISHTASLECIRIDVFTHQLN
jgi:hypothetical protein